MTLIAGFKCNDGFVIAADTAITVGNIVYAGSKIHRFKGPAHLPYRIIIACAGDFSISRSAIEKIGTQAKDLASVLKSMAIEELTAIVENTVDDLWKKNVYPYLRDELNDIAPQFNLIVGIVLNDDFALLISDQENVAPIDSFAFQGSGFDVAAGLIHTLVESPGNSILTFPASVGAHIAIEILRIAKLYGASVGLDSEVIAWRRSNSYNSFTQPRIGQPANSDLGAIQENLKSAIWDAFEKSNISSTGFDAKIDNIVRFLRDIRAHTESQSNTDTRFARYLLSRIEGTWSMADLEPNR